VVERSRRRKVGLATFGISRGGRPSSAAGCVEVSKCWRVVMEQSFDARRLVHKQTMPNLWVSRRVARGYARKYEHGGGRVGKAGTNLSVKVRPGQSRADGPAASLAGVAATRGLKRRQQVHGVYGSNPEMCLSWRPSWNPLQRRQHGRCRYARERLLHRGLRVGHVHTVDIGTQEIRQGPLVGHQRECQGREDRRLALSPGRKSDWSIVSMKSPKATR
jgi:hypothetical protein